MNYFPDQGPEDSRQADPELNSWVENIYEDVHWTTTDGVSIVSRQWTVPNPRGWVLLIHGMGDHSGRFEHLAAHQNRNGYCVLAPDLRGHGRTAGQRGNIKSMDALLDDMQYALDLVKRHSVDSLPVFIYGQSFGGLLNILFTLKRQPAIAGIIASSPALRVAMDTPAWKVVLGKCIGKVFPRFAIKTGLSLEELSDDPQVASRARSDRFRHGKITPAAYFGMVEAGQWCLENAHHLPCPCLLMHGDADRITDHTASEEFSKRTDQCELVIRKNGKHELHQMTCRKEILDEITRFQNMCIHEGSLKTD